MSNLNKLVLVTGASGFLASHIIEVLIREGYRVRGTARGSKLELTRAVYASNPNVEIVEVADITTGDFTPFLNDVFAVIHPASPMIGRQSPQKMLESAIEGSLNVLRQAEAVGVKKFVVTGSLTAVAGDPTIKGNVLRSHNWSPVTKEQAISEDSPPMITYVGAKKFAELAIHEWAEAHPHVDVTIILPPFLYGPLATPSFLPSEPEFDFMTSDLVIYNFIYPKGEFPPRGGHADVRDVASAHVKSLSHPQGSVEGRKRVLFASPYEFRVPDVLELIRERRPELKDRLNQGPFPPQVIFNYDVDLEFVEKATGFKRSDFHKLEETVLDTVDSLLGLEDHWRKNGHPVEHIPPFKL